MFEKELRGADIRLNDGTRMPSVWLLGVASSLSPFGITMAIPVLVSIATHFGADYASVQFVISAYILGLALAQPFTGILSDRFGRRPVMLIGFAVFVAASVGAAWINSLTGLVVLRFLQAIGVSVGTVASRAVVRDTRGPLETAVALSHIAAVMGFAPIVAPVLGGWLGTLGGYRSVFVATAAMGLFVWVLMYRTLPETLDRSRASPRLRELLKNYRVLFRSRMFLGYTMLFGFVQGSFFTFMAVGAAVFETDLGMDASGFGTVWALTALTYVGGTVLCARITRATGAARVMGVTVALTFVAGWLMVLLTAELGPGRVAILLPLTMLMAAAGGIIPGSLAGVVNAHPEMSGTASGLSSAMGMVLGGVFTVLAGILYDGELAPVSLLVATSCTLTALSWMLVRSMAHTGPR